MKNVVLEWRIRACDTCFYALLSGGLFLLGSVIRYVAWLFGNSNHTVPAGTLIAGIALIWIVIAGFGADLYMGFDLAVSFGRSRKNFLRGTMAVYLINAFLLILEMRLLLEAEKILYEMLYGGLSVNKSVYTYLSLPWLLVYAVLLAGAAGSAGTIVHRFGARGLYALIFIWIVSFSLLQSKIQIMEEIRKNLLEFFTFPPTGQMAIVLLAGIAGCAVPFLGLRKAAVN